MFAEDLAMNRYARLITLCLALMPGAYAQAAPADGANQITCLSPDATSAAAPVLIWHDPCRLDDANRIDSYAEGLENQAPAQVVRSDNWLMPRAGITAQDVGMRHYDARPASTPRQPPAVPEPATYLTMLAGLIVIAFARRKKRQPKLPS
jgi:hypothetical protein